MYKTQSLLSQVSAISKQYGKIAEVTGENFNLFRILGLTTNEVRTHSAFIGELLNPKGSHGQGDFFLKLFCKQLQIENFTCEGALVDIEKYIGPKTECCTEGGSIDILITGNDNNAIIIENKINAGDQEKQLLRYCNFGRKKYKLCSLFYLTLEGKDPSELSKSGLKENVDYNNISYSEHILKWLEKCKEKAVNHPILRESITQYIYLIKHLTHQTINKEMEKELVSVIINNRDYIESAEEIANSWNQVKLGIMDNLKIRIETEVAQRLGLKVEFEQTLGKKDSGFYFFNDDWRYGIWFYFINDFESVQVGIGAIRAGDKIDPEFVKLVNQKLSNITNEKTTAPDWAWVSTFEDWDRTSWNDVVSNIPGAIVKSVEKILDNLEGIKL